MAETGLAARRGAIALLDQVLGDKRLLSEALAAGTLDRLPPADRARAQRLATDTLRGLERADRLLQKQMRKPPPLSVRNALRVGTVELCHGEAAHGVVHSMVEIVASHRRHKALKGLVNAVLRKIAEAGPQIWPTLRTPRLPKWLRTPLVDAWGADAMQAMEAAHFAGAPLDLTLRPDAELSPEALQATRLPTGSLRRHDPAQVSALPGYDSGAWWVQDAAAALPAQVLDAKPGEAVLDLCAAPGGKTLQLAATGAQVTALDISETRMARVRDNLARTGLQAQCVVADALTFEGAFDAILLDAPCSATGTMRRHPDLPYAKDGSEFGTLIALQAQLLARAWGLLRPGGRLVFCTCSLLPDEGEVHVEAALGAMPNMSIAPPSLPGLDPAWISSEGGLRLRPDYWSDLGGMDGFYIALLHKAA